MASKQNIVDFLVEQMSGVSNVTSRKMFGEYAVYSDGKVVALICDDELYIKPTEEGKAFITKFVKKPPYPGAKPYLLMTNEKWDDREWISELINITTSALQLPKKKR